MVNAADHRFTGSTAVAAERIELSRTRVWAASVPSTSCVVAIERWYPWRELHPRTWLERPESWLLDDTDRKRKDGGVVRQNDGQGSESKLVRSHPCGNLEPVALTAPLARVTAVGTQ